MARSEEIRELFFTALFLTHCSVSPSDLEDLDCGIRPRGFRKEPHWNLDKLESRLRTALTSYGKSAKFPLASLDSVDNLVISCWPPLTAASFPPASSHPSINPVQPWTSAQCSRGLDSPRRAEFPGSRTSCVPRGDVSTEGKFGPVVESKALMYSNCVGTCGGSVRRQMVNQAGSTTKAVLSGERGEHACKCVCVSGRHYSCCLFNKFFPIEKVCPSR